MQIKRIGEHFVMRMEEGEEVMASLHAWAREQRVGFATLQAIGALRGATLGYFDSAVNEYRHLAVDEQVEVVNLSGSVSRAEDGSPAVHVHVVLGRADGRTLGGHLVEGSVFPTLEVVLLPLPEAVRRRRDPATGLALWDLEA